MIGIGIGIGFVTMNHRSPIVSAGIHKAEEQGQFVPLGEVIEPEGVILSPEEVMAAWKLPADHRSRLIEAGSVPLAVIQELMRQPTSFFKLGHRQFEWVIAEMLSRLGFRNIALTPRSADGGKDIIASNSVAGIPVVFYFECKHHGEDSPVDIVDLRALMGVVKGRESTAAVGVLATTGRFTKGGRKYIASEAQLDGKDYSDLVGWVNQLKL